MRDPGPCEHCRLLGQHGAHGADLLAVGHERDEDPHIPSTARAQDALELRAEDLGVAEAVADAAQSQRGAPEELVLPRSKMRSTTGCGATRRQRSV